MVEETDIITLLKNSNNKFLQAEGEDAEVWKNVKLESLKKYLELFLNWHVAEIHYRKPHDNTTYGVICTSNTDLIKSFAKNLSVQDKKKIVKLTSKGIHCREMTQVRSYNLLKHTYCTITLKNVVVAKALMITPKNVLLLHEWLNDILKRK